VLERSGLVGVRERHEPLPVPWRQDALVGGDRRRVGYRLVARKDAALQEAIARRVDRELEVAVGEAGGDPRIERRHEPVDVGDLHHAAQLAAQDEAQRHCRDCAEQPVAADREAEEVRILRAAAATRLAGGVDERERLDLAHERRQVEPAAVHVRREAATDAQRIGAGLLLAEGPRGRCGARCVAQPVVQRRPAHSRLDFDQAARGVERHDPVEAARVDQQRAGAELLRAHCMAGATD
jgi:hypothetical protein